MKGNLLLFATSIVKLIAEIANQFPTSFVGKTYDKGKTAKALPPIIGKRETPWLCIVRRILPKHIADTVCLKGSRLAHLYGLPKTHKERREEPLGTMSYPLPEIVDISRP